MKTTTDHDENGIAERKEQLVQQRIICNVNDLIFSQERATIHQTTQLKHLGLCTVACIPEPVNDVDKLKQRLIEVLDGCVQQTVDEAPGERKRSFWVCSRVK